MEAEKAPRAGGSSSGVATPAAAGPAAATSSKPEVASPARIAPIAAEAGSSTAKPVIKPVAKPATPAKAPASAIVKPAVATARRPALNVKDALTYLDQVKLRFEKQPEIYNRFLDIMLVASFSAHAREGPPYADCPSIAIQERL